MKICYLLGVVAFSGVLQIASAQSSSYYSSYSDANFTLDPDITTSFDKANVGGTYNNMINPVQTGDGVNNVPYTYGDEYYDNNFQNIIEVDNYAEATSTATTGSASQFWGYNHFIDFTNNGATDESVTITEYIEQYIDASATPGMYSLSSAYAGVGYNLSDGTFVGSYFTNTIDSNGVATANYQNTSGGYIAGDYYSGTATFTFTVAAGATINVQEWASGSTQVQPAPEPITVGLGIAAVGAVIRKRRKSNT